MSKIERQFNLIALLLDTERPRTAAEIREAIPGYHDQSDEAFHRMFERDKTEIKDLGYDLTQEDTDAWGGETGYRIPRDSAVIADPGLTADELAALSLAEQLGGAGTGALGALKLGASEGPGALGWVLPRVSLDGPIETLRDAMVRRKHVTFRYRASGSDEVTERTVDPYRLRHRGDWYLTGWDHSRDALRHFKLSRLEGKITINTGDEADFEPPAEVDADLMRGPWDGGDDMTARVAFAPDVAWWVRRRTGATDERARDDGWVELTIPVAGVEAFAGWVAGFGARAHVIAPDEVRDAVIVHLRAALGEGADAG